MLKSWVVIYRKLSQRTVSQLTSMDRQTMSYRRLNSDQCLCLLSFVVSSGLKRKAKHFYSKDIFPVNITKDYEHFNSRSLIIRTSKQKRVNN